MRGRPGACISLWTVKMVKQHARPASHFHSVSNATGTCTHGAVSQSVLASVGTAIVRKGKNGEQLGFYFFQSASRRPCSYSETPPSTSKSYMEKKWQSSTSQPATSLHQAPIT